MFNNATGIKGGMMDDTTGKSATGFWTAQKKDCLWAVKLSFFCLIIIGYGFFFSENQHGNPFLLVLFNLPVAAVLWGIFHFLFERQNREKSPVHSFTTLYVCLILSGYIGFVKNTPDVIQTQAVESVPAEQPVSQQSSATFDHLSFFFVS